MYIHINVYMLIFLCFPYPFKEIREYDAIQLTVYGSLIQESVN